ncbi:hypothetical protein ARSEF4850_006208 [Beauveria asiatica]
MAGSSNTGTTALPVHRRIIFKIVQALMHAINRNQAEVAACLAALPDSVPLIYSVLPSAEPGSLPTPALEAVHTTDESSSEEPPSPENSPAKSKKPDNAYKRAVAIANRLPLELGSADVLSELQHDLQRERARAHHNAQQRQRANPEPMLQSAEEAGTHFENLEDHYRNLQPSSPLKTAAERYFYVVVAQCYNAAKHNKAKHTYSVAEEFARKYLPATVKEGLSGEKLQAKWKALMHQQSFWEQLATVCGGAGVLLLLPAEFQKEHARRLKIEDRATLFTSIAARHPNLKYDITVLTDLLTYYYYNKVLPEWQIPLENLPEADIATRRQRGLRELVLFDVASHFASDGGDSATPPNTPSLNSLVDPSMLDYEYTEDQPMDFTPFSSGHGQEFIPPNSEAVQEGLGIPSDVDESMHELSCTGIPGMYSGMLMSPDQLQLFNQ